MLRRNSMQTTTLMKLLYNGHVLTIMSLSSFRRYTGDSQVDKNQGIWNYFLYIVFIFLSFASQFDTLHSFLKQFI